MIEATAPPEKLESVFTSVNAVVDSAVFTVTDNVLYTRVIDKPKVAIVETRASADCFDTAPSLNTHNPDKVPFQIKTEPVCDHLTFIKQDSSVTAVDIKLNTDRQQFTVVGGGFEYTADLLDTNAVRDRPDMQQLSYPDDCTVIMSGKKYKRGISGINRRIDDDDAKVKIGFTENGDKSGNFHIQGHTDTEQTAFRQRAQDVNRLNPGSQSAVCQLEYLKSIADIANKKSAVKIQLGEANKPIKIHVGLADGSINTAITVAQCIPETQQREETQVEPAA
jgi:hypothetical protein